MNNASYASSLRFVCIALACAGYAALTACSGADGDLARFVEDTKKKKIQVQRSKEQYDLNKKVQKQTKIKFK